MLLFIISYRRVLIVFFQLFFNSPENCKSSTVIEAISVTRKTIPPYIILQGQQKMENWFNKKLDGETSLDMSDSGFSNNQIGPSQLKHFIKYTKALLQVQRSFFCLIDIALIIQTSFNSQQLLTILFFIYFLLILLISCNLQILAVFKLINTFINLLFIKLFGICKLYIVMQISLKIFLKFESRQ